jgi:uncharacterized tellurite resistance protein B-like protein
VIRLLKDLFAEPDPQGRSEHDIHLAAAALLIEVARADHQQDDAEAAAMTTLLAEALDLESTEVAALLQRAGSAVEEATSLFDFTRLVNDHYQPSDKRRLIESMWQVAYADGNLDKYEEHIIRRVAELIYLPHTEFIQSKHAARDGR